MAAPNTRIVLDLVRDTNTIVNLTPYFQGRVNDSEAPLPMALVMSGRACDLTGKDVVFQGKDHEGTPFTVYGSADDANNGDSWHKGRITMRFPAGVFQTPGEWTEAFFRVVDNNVDPEKSTAIISTLNVGLNVLDDGVSATITRQAYHSRGETLVEQMEADYSGFADEITKMRQKINADSFIQQVKSLQSTIDNYSQLISSKAVPTFNDMQNYVSSLLGAQTSSDDLNLLLDQGSYVITNANASNNPAKTTGTLIVSGDNDDNISQLFIDTQANLWVRSGGTQGWSDWREQTAWN